MVCSKITKALVVLLILTGSTLGIRAQVTADFNIVAPVPNCNPAVYNFINSSTGTAPLSYEWNFGVYPGINSILQNPGTTYLNCGTFTVKLVVTDGLGMKDSISKSITVHCSPVPNFTVSTLSGCVPLNTEFTSTSLAGSGTITNYIWDFGDGDGGSDATPNHTYREEGCKNITLIVTNSFNCVSDTTIQNALCAYDPPVAEFTSSDSASCVVPFNVVYQPSVSQGLPNYTYQWVFEGGNPSTSDSENPSVTYDSSGNFSTTLIITDANGCSDTIVKNNFIKVDVPSVDFSVSSVTGCVPATISATELSTDIVVHREWTVTPAAQIDSANSPIPIITFSDSGMYQICLESEFANGCTAQKCTSVVIHSLPSAHFSITGNLNTCIRPNEIIFTDSSSGNNLTYNWNFPGGSPAAYDSSAPPPVSYSSCGVFSASLTVTDENGCSDAYDVQNFLTITCPQVSFDVSPRAGCLPLSATFNSDSTVGNPVSWLWTFGDPASGASDTSTERYPSHIYTTAGCYTVTLTTVNAEGCTATSSIPQAVCAGDKPVADFSGTPAINCANQPIYFQNQSTNVYDYTHYSWDFNGGPPYETQSTEENPSYIFSDTGYFDISLIVSNFGCNDTIQKNDFVLLLPPVAVADLTRDCNNHFEVTLDATRSMGAQRYLWTIPDGNPSASTDSIVTVTFSAAGIYSASLSIYNDSTGCSDNTTVPITIKDVKADFTASPLNGCAPLNACMNNASTDAVTYQWTVTDSSGAVVSSSTSANPCFNLTEAGVYSVQLIATDMFGCENILNRPDYITVYKSLVGFSGIPLSGCAPLETHFTDSSSSINSTIVSWNWNFGDPLSGTNDTSTQQNPIHYYNQPGYYNVSLTVTDDKGCQQTLTKFNYIHAIRPSVGFTTSNSNTCKGSSACFTNTSSGSGLSYHWDFGDSTTSSSVNPCHVYTANGDYTIKLIVTDNTGCADSIIRNNFLHVTKPVADFESDTTHSSCPPLSVHFTDKSTDTDSITSYLWKFGDGQISSQENPTHIYNIPGNFDVTLIVTNQYGCKDTIVFPQHIQISGPTAFITTPPTSGCLPHTTCFAATSPSTISYTWNFGDGTIDNSGDSVCHTYITTGTFYSELILNDGVGCIYSLPIGTVNVTGAVAGFSMTDSVFCPNEIILFNDSSYGGSAVQSWYWDFGDGDTSNLKNPTHHYSAQGVYTVTLTILTTDGCSSSKVKTLRIREAPAITVLSATDDTCYSNRAAATVAVTDGTPDYQYTWNTVPAQTTATVTGLLGGTSYTVTITDANGCKTQGNVSINNMQGPSVSITANSSPCYFFGGTITTTVTGGTEPYTYNWNSGIYDTSDLNSLSSGTYSLLLTDANGCEVTDTAIIQNSLMQELSAGGISSTCGKNNGSVWLSVSGGANPFTYLWSNGSSEETIDSLFAGGYGITVTDTNGCVASDSVTVDDIEGPTVSYSVVQPSCGQFNGSINLTVSGGAIPYTFLWSDGTDSSALINLSAGTYISTVTDGNGCEAATTILLNDGVPMSLAFSHTDESCLLNDGSAGVTVSGGISPYTFLWNNGATTQNISGLSAGTYILTVTDAANCTEYGSVVVNTLGGAPVVNVSSGTPVICFSQSTTLSVSGAVSYSWLPSAGLSSTTGATVTANPVTTTTYTVVGTASSGCTASASIVITVQSLPTLSVSGNTIICPGNTTTLTANGAATYKWSPATGLSSTTGSSVISSPLSNITYTVTGTDAIGCSSTLSVPVSRTSNPVISLSPSNPILCYGNAATMIASGASVYTWSPSAGLNQTSGASVIASPTITTTYTVTGTDINGCSSSATTVITSVSPSPVDAGPGGTICVGNSLQLNGSGATLYSWSPAAGLNNSTISNPVASPTVTTTYYLTGRVPTGNLITNGNFNAGNTGFSSSYTYATNLNPEGLYWVGKNAHTVHSNFFCTDHTSGSGNMMVVNGAPDPGVDVWCQTINVIPNSLYDFSTWVQTVSPAANPALLQFSVNGTMLNTPFAASPTMCNWQQFHAMWNSGANTTATICIVNQNTIRSGNDFALDDISFSVLCESYDSVVVVVNPPPVISAIPSADSICIGSVASVTVTGASNYKWSPSTGLNTTTGSTVTASPAATTTYTINGTDANGCSGSTTVVINVPTPPSVSVNSTNPSFCSGDSTILTVSGAAYYSWSPSTGLNTTNGSAVTASPAVTTTYTVTGYDLNGCTNTDNVIVTVYPAPVLSVTPDNPSICFGSSTTMTASGAVSYTWLPDIAISSTTGASVTANPTVSMTYTVTGTAVNGCTSSAIARVTTGSSLSLGVISNSAGICAGNSDTLIATGAISYVWSPSAGLNTTNGSTVITTPASTTTYTVTGVDALGCSGTGTAEVIVNQLPVISVNPTSSNLCTGDSVLLVATGTVSYNWNPSSGLVFISNDSAYAIASNNTTYTINGTDINGCSASVSTVINVYNPPTLTLTTGNTTLCFGESTTLSVSGATTYLWTPSSTLSDSTGTNVNAYPSDNTTYSVTGKSPAGCTATDSVIVSVNPPVVLTVTPYNPTICNGSTVTLNASGAVTYEWTPATGLSATTGSSVTASPTLTTTYTITGRDSSGCVGFNALIVTVGDFISLNATANPSALCVGDSALLTVSGVTHYSWSPATSLSDSTGSSVIASPTVSTTYTITGTDAIGCTGMTELPVTVYPAPVISATPDSALTCAGSAVVLQATGGIDYSWSPAIYLSNTTGSTVTVTPMGNITYTVTGIDGNGCMNNDSVSVKVTQGTPVVVSPIADTVCRGQSTVLTASGSISYEWFPSAGLNVTSGDMVIATPDSTTTYTVTGTDSNGCKSSAETIIIVNPQPVISALDNPTICAGSSTTLTVSGGVNYSWSPSTGLNTTTESSVVASPTVSTTYIVFGENSSGCYGFTTVTVNIGAGLSVRINSDTTAICQGKSVTLTAYGADNYTWLPATGLSVDTGSVVTANPVSSMTYTVTGTDVSGCTGDTTFVVTVYPNPVITSSNHILCSGDSVLLSVTGAENYLWSPAAGLSDTTGSSILAHPATTTTYSISGTNLYGCTDTTSAVITINPVTPVSITNIDSLVCAGTPPVTLAASPAGGIFSGSGITGGIFYPDSIGTGATSVIRYSYTNSSGCFSSDSIAVTVIPSPSLSVTPAAGSICVNSSITLYASGAEHYQWTPSSGLSSAIDSITIASPDATTTYTITGSNSAGCADSDSVIVRVNPLPVVTVSPSVTSICNGSSATLTANGAKTYQWTPSTGLNTDTGNTVTANPLVHTTYSVFGTDSAGCSSVATAIVNVGAPVKIINTPSNPAICENDSVSVMLTGAVTYTWTPSTGLSATTGANVVASPSVTTSYTVVGLDSNGCSGQVSFVIVVNPKLEINGYTTEICKGTSATLIATGANLFMWNADTTLSSLFSSTVTATPVVTTTYIVTGWNSYGCSDTAQFNVVVRQLPVVDFIGLKPDYCIASAADTLTGVPSGGIFSGSGVTRNTFNPQLAGTGGPYIINYTYTDSYGCSDSVSRNTNVNNGAIITVTPEHSTVCSSSSTTLSASGGISYLWTPAISLNTSSGEVVTANPDINTTYTVTGTDVNGCSGIATAEVNIGNRISLTITSGADSICAGSSVTFTVSGADTYEWSPTAGLNATTGSTVNVSPAITTTYTIKGTDAGGCSGDTTFVVTVKPLPDVSVNNTSVCSGNTVILKSKGATDYKWFPGNLSGDRIAVNPSFTSSYTVTGYTDGCSDTAVSVVTVNPIPAISVNNPSICEGNSGVLTASGASNYLWSNGSTTKSITVSPVTNTTYTVTGYLNGCESAATASVTVNAKPIVSLSGLNPSYCSASDADMLTGLPPGGNYIGNGVNGNYFYPSITGIGGPYPVKYIYTSPAGCSDSAIQQTYINEGAAITATASEPIICISSSTILTAQGGAHYTWSPAAGLNETTGHLVTASPTATTTYTVTGINSDGCSGEATVTVSVTSNPVINITSDKPSICLGESAVLSASGATDFTWSPATGLNTASGNSVVASPASTTTYSVTGTVSGGCSGAATAIVTVQPVPVVKATSDKRLLCYNSPALLTATGATNYSWNPSTGLNTTTGKTITATPVTSTTYTVTGTNASGCISSDTISVIVNAPVILNLSSSNNTICSGNSLSLSVSGAATYSWTPSTGLNSTYGATVTATPASSMTYTINGFDSNGCSAMTSSIVKVNPLPVITAASGSSSVCSGVAATLTANGGINYSWSPSTGLNTTTGKVISANPVTSVTYTVTGFDSNGCSAVSQVPLKVNPVPVIDISVNNPEICTGSSAILSAGGAVSYNWSPAIGLNQATGAAVIASPVATTSYHVTGSDSNGCTSSSVTVIKVLPKPVLTIRISDSALCSGESAYLQANGAASYEWSPASGLSSTSGSSVSAQPSSTTVYYLNGVDLSGCSSGSSVTVVVHPNPVLKINPSNPVLCKGNSIPLTVSGASSYIWSPSSGLSMTTGSTVSAMPVAGTTYSITGTDINGCNSETFTVVEVGEDVTLATSSSLSKLCEGQSAALSVSGAVTYQWSPSSGLNNSTGNEVVASPPSSQTYTVIGTNNSGCADTAVIPLNVFPNPVITVSQDAAICYGEKAQLNATGNGAYNWSPAGSLTATDIQNPVASPLSTTTYIVSVTDIEGCSSQDSIIVTVHNKPFADAGSDTLVCSGDSIRLHAREGQYYQWMPQDFLSDARSPEPVCKPLHNIIYTLTVTDPFGCINTDSVQIFLKNPLDIQASPGATVCEGGVVQLYATGGNSYIWSPKEGLDNPYLPNPVASPARTTSYTVTSTDGICFTASDVTVVTVNAQPYLSVTADVEIVAGQNFQLHAYGSGTFTWSPPDFLSCTDCPNPTVIHPDKPMTYTVTVVDSSGCRREDDVSISLTCKDDAVYVPDAFTPNGDRRNDIFRVRSYGLQHVTSFRVFSRWGELVFETSDLNQGWDGTYRGQLCSPAVYVWYLEGVCSDGGKILKQGNVTLIR